MRVSDFDFDLPEKLIALHPAEPRDSARLLVVDPEVGLSDRHVPDLLWLLKPGDVLVVNDTRVLPARLYGRKESGGAVEILLERVTGAHEAIVQLGVSKKPKEGGRIELTTP